MKIRSLPFKAEIFHSGTLMYHFNYKSITKVLRLAYGEL